jgi:chromosome segregation ATPase
MSANSVSTKAKGSDTDALLAAKISQLEASKKPPQPPVNRKQELKKLMGSEGTAEEKLVALRRLHENLIVEESSKAKAADDYSRQLGLSNTHKKKLEQLCRELQVRNKSIVGDSQKAIQLEQDKRQELSAKFNDSIADISKKMEGQNAAFTENDSLREKLKTFMEQYEIREKQWEKQTQAHDLQLQLSEAKLNQANAVAKHWEEKALAYAENIEQLLDTEKALRGQLEVYTEKFDSFQNTLSQSNEVFGTFKTEMDKMTKTIKKFEKENKSLKKKNSEYEVKTINMLGERTDQLAELKTLRVQKGKLETLCRTMQTDRAAKKKELEELQAELKEVRGGADGAKAGDAGEKDAGEEESASKIS